MFVTLNIFNVFLCFWTQKKKTKHSVTMTQSNYVCSLEKMFVLLTLERRVQSSDTHASILGKNIFIEK